MKLNKGWSVWGLSLFLAAGCGGASPDAEQQPRTDVGVTDPEQLVAGNEQGLADPVHFSPPAPWSTVTSRFSASHTGVDFGNPSPGAVKAIERGRIVDRQQEACHGKYVVVKHPNGVYSMYAHLNTVGDDIHNDVSIEKGKVLGTAGATGTCANGVHLHLSMKNAWTGEASWRNGGFFDPEAYIKNNP